jgi:hypothetical protein
MAESILEPYIEEQNNTHLVGSRFKCKNAFGSTEIFLSYSSF